MKYARNEEEVKIYLAELYGQEYDARDVVYLMNGYVAEFDFENGMCIVYDGADSDNVVEEISFDYETYLNHATNRVPEYLNS